jgi:hypothetical protein
MRKKAGTKPATKKPAKVQKIIASPWNSCSLDALRSLSACFPRTTLRFKSRFHPAPPISAHAVQSLWFVLVESPATVLAYLVRIKLHQGSF